MPVSSGQHMALDACSCYPFLVQQYVPSMNHSALRNSLSSYYMSKTVPSLTLQDPPSGQGLFQDTYGHFFLHRKLCQTSPLFFNTPLTCWLAVRFGDRGRAKQISVSFHMSQPTYSQQNILIHAPTGLSAKSYLHFLEQSWHKLCRETGAQGAAETQLLPIFTHADLLCYPAQHSTGQLPPFFAQNNLSLSDPLSSIFRFFSLQFCFLRPSVIRFTAQHYSLADYPICLFQLPFLSCGWPSQRSSSFSLSFLYSSCHHSLPHGHLSLEVPLVLIHNSFHPSIQAHQAPTYPLHLKHRPQPHKSLLHSWG